MAVLFAAVQAVAAGVVVSGLRVGLGVAVGCVLLGSLLVGLRHSAPAALLVSAGVSHATLYSLLLVVFASSLRPGRESVVTGLARQINPHFHAGMVPYTRGVTWAWCVFFGGQLAVSAGLLALAPGAWRPFVTALHAPLVAAMALGEFAVRRWRWRHERYTGLRDTIAGMRRIRFAAVDGAGGGRTSPPA